MHKIEKSHYAERPRFSVSEAFLSLLVGAALVGGIYGVYRLAMRDVRVEDAIRMISELRQFDFASVDTSVKNPWNGAVRLSRGDSGLTISMDNIPPVSCLEMGQMFMPDDDPDLVSLTVGETVFGEAGEQISSDTLTAACGADKPVTMTWQYP